jgi:GNAT superfamily N-acetyltransferase
MKFVVVIAEMRDSIIAKRPNVVEYFDRRLTAVSSGSAVWFAAVDDAGDVLGWVILNRAAAGRDATIEDLWVVESHRRKGVGAALMEEAERLARAAGEPTLRLGVNPTESQPAARLYERLGYNYEGGAAYLDGVYDGFEDWVVDMLKSL